MWAKNKQKWHKIWMKIQNYWSLKLTKSNKMRFISNVKTFEKTLKITLKNLLSIYSNV